MLLIRVAYRTSRPKSYMDYTAYGDRIIRPALRQKYIWRFKVISCDYDKSDNDIYIGIEGHCMSTKHPAHYLMGCGGRIYSNVPDRYGIDDDDGFLGFQTGDAVKMTLDFSGK